MRSSKDVYYESIQPRNPKTAQETKQTEERRLSMETEIKALNKNGTWDKCRLPERKRPARCR